MKKIIVTLDGPAGSGKSTTARIVAERLGYAYLDTGAMYRAIALYVLRQKTSVTDIEKVIRLLSEIRIDIIYENKIQKTFLNGEDVSSEIRSPEVTQSVSPISGIKEVRKFLREQQQAIGANGGYVVDGRDIGTAVFPNAEVKFFLTARVEERAKRREKEFKERYGITDFKSIVADIERRDLEDSTRKEDPLKIPADAIILDNSDLTVAQQVDFILEKIKSKAVI